MSILIHNLTFGWATPLIKDLSCIFERGWSAAVGINGAGKSTLLELISGGLEPEEGRVEVRGELVYCRQIAEELPDDAVPLFEDGSSEAYRLKLRFGITEDWKDRWSTLSFGERKRIQIASAFYRQPDVLLLDEPTNHLDSESRELLIPALKAFRGTGILVSHDRMLLDELCYQTLFLEPPGHDLRGQAYTDAKTARDAEAEYRAEQRNIIRKEVRKLEKRASHYRGLACSADKRKSKKNIRRGDHDASLKMDTARILGKDATHGKLMNQLQGRIKHQNDRLDTIETNSKSSFNFSLQFLPGRRKNLFAVEEGEILMGQKKLVFKAFRLDSDKRAAITGANGSGKSTLLKHIFTRCRKERTLYIPQELTKEQIIFFFNELNELDRKERGEIYSIMAALGSDPERVLLAEAPSPGEIRKLLIADAVRKKIELLILDEPTNHLDLHSIEALEAALSEYRAGLVLVSHDRYFIEKTTEIQWEISRIRENEYELTI